MKTTVKTISAIVISLVITAAQVLASGDGGNGDGFSLLTTFFIAFGVVILLFQFVPGLMLFGGMFKGIFPASEKKSGNVLAGSADKHS